MSTVQRAVYINPIEPSPLSLRVPSGMETRIAFTMYTQKGSATTDLLAQLELAARSGGPGRYYSVPSTDPINGRASCIIPAGDLTDPNGYRLNLYGTVDGEPMLLATGKVDVLAAAGPKAVPADVIDQIDLTLRYGEAAQIDVKVWEDAGMSNPFDLLAITVIANVLDVRGGVVLMPFAVTVTASNAVRLDLTVDQVNALPAVCWWQLSVSTAGGTTTLAEGAVNIQPAIP